MLGTKILEERKSKFNGNIRVVRSIGFGTYIQVNNLTQSGGIVKDFWNETLRKIKKEKIDNVLILGLGGGTVAKLIKKYWPNPEITGVEIDPVMVELGKRYLGLKDCKIIIHDAYEFIEKNNEKYDLVIVDLYIGDEFPKKFEEEEFLKKLIINKLVIFNRLYFGEKRKEAVKFGNKLEKIFSKVEWFYPQANLMFFCRYMGFGGKFVAFGGIH
jgi:spermidine synthase